MPMVLIQKMPAGTPFKMLEEVTEEMDVRFNPPDGLIVHTVVEMDGRITIVDVWESKEDFEAFGEERLGPAFEQVMQRLGQDPSSMGEPETTMLETLDVIRGAS